MSDIDDDFLDEDEFQELSTIVEKFDDNRAIESAWIKAHNLSCQLKEKLTETYSALNDAVISGHEKAIYWNALKKLVFLNCTFITKFEDTLSSQTHRQNFNDSTAETNPRRRKKQRPNEDENQEMMKAYDKYKERVMKQLLQLISLPLNRIADSQIEAKELVGQVMRASYKMIENSSINNLTKSNDLLGINFSILGCGIEKYNQSLGFCLKFIQLLQYKEQLAPLLADLVAYIVSHNDQRLLIGEILREIDRIDIKDLSRDSSCPKAVSTFLIALSEKCPQDFIPSLNHIFGYLEQDSYLMRNASLSIMSNLIINYLHEKEDEKALRDELLDVMLAHIRDIIGYTRSKALSVWCTLCDNQKIPLIYIVPVTSAAVGRLLDKSCYVRRSAVKFITSILSRNPYAAKLPLKTFVANYETEKAVLEKLLQEEKERLAKEDGLLETLSQGSQCTDETGSQIDEEGGRYEPNNPINNQKNVAMAEESAVVAQQRKINYLQDAIGFTKLIHKAIPLTAEMLTSKNITDIQEAINFFVHCHEFSIDEALMGFKRMILLINVQEKSVKDAVTAAYRRIFFESNRYDNKSNRESLIVTNFINFVQDASIGEALSLEILLSHFVANNDFSKELTDELWARFTGSKRNSSIEDAIGAIQILGMLATSQPNIIKQNLHLCVKHGLSNSGCSEQESRLIRETCVAIRKCLPRKIEDKQRAPLRLARDDELFQRLETILVDSLTNIECKHWFSLCDESMRIIFDMAESPDKIGESIFNKMSDELLRNSVQSNSLVNQENRNESPDFVFQPSTMQTTTGSGATTTQIHQNMEQVDSMALARFIHFLGDLALDLAVFLELHVLIELKKRTATTNDDVNHNISTHNISISSRRRSRRYGGANKSMDEANLEEEIGLGGAEAEDAEMEFIGGICDEEVVCGNSLLAKMSRVIIEVCTDPVRYPNIELKLSSCLALAKYMMVSAKYCNNHLRLLFTILERSKENHIKINLLVAISDLCIRFPNQLDGWTGKIFDCLQSDDVAVRRAALKILSRLVLSDILKAKDQISTIANLIVDKDDQIASFSRHFFLELSKKLNAIYNVLPDIISRLSDSKNGIEEPDFRIVMKFMFELIDKSHHIDRLVDKLCGRFMDTDDERHWCDLAFCLSLLKYSDKSMAKLYDKFDCYKDKLCIDSVKESITSVIANYRKTPQLRDDMKNMLDEMELKIAKCVEVAEEEAELSQNISMAKGGGDVSSATEEDISKTQNDMDVTEED